MDILAILAITGLFAALGFFVAVKLSPDRKENRDKFLMTALICVALAVVVSGLVRRPVVKLIREAGQEQPDLTDPTKLTDPTELQSPADLDQAGQEPPNASSPKPSESIEQVITANELYGLLREAEPEVAAAFLERAVAMHEQGAGEGVNLSLSDRQVSTLLWEKFATDAVNMAPDHAAELFARGLSERLHHYLKADSDMALALLSPRSFPDGDASMLALTGSFGKGVRTVVMGAYRNPTPRYDPEQSRQLFEAAMQDFVAHLDETRGSLPDLSEHLDLLGDPEALAENTDPALARTVADMLDFFLDRPQPERAVLIKYLFSGPQ